MTRLEKLLNELLEDKTISVNEKEALKACVEVASEDPDAIADNTVLAGLFTLNKETSNFKAYCSFCNKSEDVVNKIIRGQNEAAICDYCVVLCKEIVEEEQ